MILQNVIVTSENELVIIAGENGTQSEIKLNVFDAKKLRDRISAELPGMISQRKTKLAEDMVEVKKLVDEIDNLANDDGKQG